MQTAWDNRARFELVANLYARDSPRTFPLVYPAELTPEDDIATTPRQRPGIYRTFAELRQNRPSLTGPLFLSDSTGDFTTLRKPSGSRARYRFFGFSDGTTGFVNTGGYSGQRFRYARVKSLGPRHWFWSDDYLSAKEATARAASVGFGLLGALAASTATTRDCMALDLQTGKISPMTPETVVQLLADEPELLEEYKAAGNQKNFRAQFEVLSQLNQRKVAN